MQSEVFFLISSIGFVILGIFSVVVLFYLLRAIQTFSRILKTVEGDIASMGDTTKEMLEDMRESNVFRFLFRGKSRVREKKTGGGVKKN